MQNKLLTATYLKRFNSAIFSVKELIEANKIDGYDHMIDTLLLAYYGIEEIIEGIEIETRAEITKRMAQKQK